MKTNLHYLISVMAFLFSLTSFSPLMAQAGGNIPAPFGFAVGKATVNDVKAGLRGKVRVEDNGINKFSRGPMLKTPGRELDMEGLQEVLFIFDAKQTLAALVMTLDKNRFDQVYDHLADKYTLVHKQIPFVGDKYAKFRHGNIITELDAPHLSFSMEVRYMTEQFLANYNATTREEEQRKRNRERGQF